MPPYTSTSVLTKQLLGIVLNQQIVMEDSVQGRSSFMGQDVPSVIDTSLYIRGNTVHYFKYINDGKTRQQSEINIYELAHKCKEWAFRQRYELRTSVRGVVDVYDHVNIDSVSGLMGEFIDCHNEADTEHEAIFQACERILKDKR